VASGTSNSNTVLTGVTGTAPYQWAASTVGSGVSASCNVTTLDNQLTAGNVPVLGDTDFNQWNFSFTTTNASTGVVINQLFGATGASSSGTTLPTGVASWLNSLSPAQTWNLQWYNGNTFKALVPLGATQTEGALAKSSWLTTIGEVTNDGSVNWQALPPIVPGVVVQISVRLQLLTNPSNAPCQFLLSLMADYSSPNHNAQIFYLNCGQEVLSQSGYIGSGITNGLDNPNDYLPFGTGEEFLIQSLPLVLRDPVGSGQNLQIIMPQFSVLTEAAAAAAITFGIRDFEVRVIGQKPSTTSPMTYY
jgi:hypothetical protein